MAFTTIQFVWSFRTVRQVAQAGITGRPVSTAFAEHPTIVRGFVFWQTKTEFKAPVVE